MIAMVENHLHWTTVYWRSKDVDNILKGYKLNLQTAIGSKAPASILNFYFKYTFCRKGLKKVRANGMGVHTAEEIENFGKKDLQTLSEMLGDKEFFFPLRDYLEADCKNLVGLVNRMKDRCWADHWDNATGEEMDLNPHIPKPEPPAPEPEKEEEEKEKAEEKKETKEKVNMMTKLSNAFSKLKPQPSAAASAAPEAKAEETPSDKPEAETEEKKEEEKKEEEKKEEENKENKEKSEEKK